MAKIHAFLLAPIGFAYAFPWVANIPRVDNALLRDGAKAVKRADNCPFNLNHPGAAPFNPDFPYTGARNGLPGTQKGVKVPADGDAAHAFTAPSENDIRGPCPGLNAAANHNFLSHDGITTFNELVDTQQNVYNVGYDLAVFLAAFSIAQDGDLITQKLSIGCEATSRTAPLGTTILGEEGGLNKHNTFEGDTSLTRNDFFLANGDDFSFNGTLFAMMQDTCKGNFNRENLALYRKQRYDQSRRDNPNFTYDIKSLLLYGAASFLYELFPNLGPEGNPDLPTISSFFGAVADGNGGYSHKPEQIPDDWHSRVAPYTLLDVANEIFQQYIMYPVEFGGNAGKGNFNSIGTIGGLVNGKLPDDATAADVECLLYQLATSNIPSPIAGIPVLGAAALDYLLTKINPVFQNTGCPLKPSES